MSNPADLIFYLDAANPKSYTGSTSTWFDLSPNANHFTLFNNPSRVQNGTTGTYLTFNGTTQYARSTNAINLNNYSAITIEIGFRSTSTLTQVLYETTGTGGSTTTGGISLLMNANNTSTSIANGYLSFWQGYGPRLFGFVSGINTNFNAITEIFVKGTDSTGRITYVNNSSTVYFTNSGVGTSTNATTSGLAFSNTWTYIASRAGTRNFFNGDIAWVRAWGTKINNTSLERNFNSIVSRQPNNYNNFTILRTDPAAGAVVVAPSTWPNVISGDNFPLYTPSDIVSTLGAGTIGSNSLILSSSFMTVLLNGQGRGITGTQGTTYNSSNYQITYDPTGTGTFSYTSHNDFFQPGTPYEIGMVEVGGTSGRYIGGQNQDANLIGSTTINNGTVRSWKPTSDRVVVWFTGGSSGDAIFQYYITGRALRIHMSYFNTTGTSQNIRMARGGDPDYNGATGSYESNNTRVDTSKVFATSPATGIVFAIYCPGNGYTKGTAIRTGWGANNPCTDALNNTNNGNGDNAIYAGVDCGTVAAGGNVGINFYYCFGTSSADAYGTIGV